MNNKRAHRIIYFEGLFFRVSLLFFMQLFFFGLLLTPIYALFNLDMRCSITHISNLSVINYSTYLLYKGVCAIAVYFSPLKITNYN